MHIESADLVATLKGQGLRITEPRRLVCEVIATRHDEHLSAAAIYEAVVEDLEGGANRATVYRTLDVLEEAGAIKHGHIGHGPTVYHLADESAHQHLVCNSCGRVQTVDDAAIAPLLGRITEATGFAVDVDHIALTGLCEDCSGG